MLDSRKKWEGQTVDDRFVLGEYLGGSKNNAVFFTQRGEANFQKAAIKLFPDDPATTEVQLSVWRRCAQLSHANLLPLYEFGHCRVENTAMLYVVMEFAEENLSQILPERPLTPAEARDMLQPILGALLYLKGKGFVHNSVKPSNILAAADRLKFSSDTLWPAGQPRVTLREMAPYDPPEFATAPYSPADPVWSLGITLVETLTQQVPSPQQLQKGELPSPDLLPAPFLEMARRALRIGSQQHASLEEIANCLNPGSFVTPPPVAAAPPLAPAAVSPLAVPLSPVPPLPKEQFSRPQAPPPLAARQRQEPGSSFRFLFPAAAVILLLIVIFSVSKLIQGPANAPAAASAPAEPPSSKPSVASSAPLPPANPAVANPKKAAEPVAANAIKPATEKEPVRNQEQPAAPPLAAERPSMAHTNSQSANPSHGEVLDQILPEVSQKARDTIQGKVLVTVRAHVDPSGIVTDTELDSPSSSKYFSDLALQAARRWQFQSPEADGHSLPSEWQLRFVFLPADTKVTARQVTP